ncbi:putative ankyrin repeat protein RF_0381 [Microplitis mediator]|uniref:putative ankyrin repeat protein RF_0381 n=1 Tax=Microplitis mediator TaxID=375433 RepID=UPI002556D38E|nr:putative ankyrin repeat protein RF_0381 [Microplitis mediator]
MLGNRESLCVNTIKPSALHRAVKNSDLKVVNDLLQDPEIDINKNVYYWDTALHLAVRDSNLALITKLLDHGANIDILSFAEGYTPLHIAVINKNSSIVELLLIRGANINAVSTNFMNKYWTPLHFAISQNNYPLIELLLKYNADINGIHYKNSIIIDADDFDAGKNNSQFYYYKTPLHIAIECRKIPTVKYLLNLSNININSVDSNYAKKYASLLYEALKVESSEIVKLLIDGEININAVNEANQTVLDCINHMDNLNLYNRNRNEDINGCMEIVKQHLVKLHVINYYLINQNLNLISDHYFDSYRTKCLQEIKIMKKIIIDKSNLTYYGVLYKTEIALAVYVRNIDQGVIDYDELVKRLPIYGGIVYFRLKKVLKRCRLLDKTEKIIFKTFNQLPDTFIRDIFLYLTNDDLIKLID